MTRPLSAPLDVGFDYTRSLGPTLGRFLSDLRRRRVTGIRGSDGRVHVPPLEYDPVTAESLHEFVDVAATGVVRGWSWIPEPLEGQPLDRPFAWALIQLDGADTSLLHAVDAGTPDQISTGARVRVRWRAERVGAITDIECFEISDEPADEPVAADDVTMVTTPVNLHYTHSASPTEDPFLRGLMEGRLLGQRCPSCEKVYFPPRPACPTDGVPTTDQVELADHGTITTYCVVNVPFLGQRIPPPYVSAYVLLDGADIPFLHLLLGVAPEDVRMGMRVEAVWKPREEWGPTMQNIDHFRPSGEPDAPFDSYSQHL
ncbi:OB-fold nucleic acid binding domain-containing protein [Lentzea sp. NBRC 102530]|uniref:Zn-ribbon domain-containing OB-fold protein n=1 Tax=Lentzea sp. NBRC 102530 TaxID=3032201 RepID=UPI0024A29788|nr:OB-fold nucleic acid binding domain-containing protein [Lentzea sp. NBRC 102530]GLY47492.1 DNA-binding protein [Lentzea sp. NBRC 102530]